jgi:hypothetical protein
MSNLKKSSQRPSAVRSVSGSILRRNYSIQMPKAPDRQYMKLAPRLSRRSLSQNSKFHPYLLKNCNTVPILSTRQERVLIIFLTHADSTATLSIKLLNFKEFV